MNYLYNSHCLHIYESTCYCSKLHPTKPMSLLMHHWVKAESKGRMTTNNQTSFFRSTGKAENLHRRRFTEMLLIRTSCWGTECGKDSFVQQWLSATDSGTDSQRNFLLAFVMYSTCSTQNIFLLKFSEVLNLLWKHEDRLSYKPLSSFSLCRFFHSCIEIKLIFP